MFKYENKSKINLSILPERAGSGYAH